MRKVRKIDSNYIRGRPDLPTDLDTSFARPSSLPSTQYHNHMKVLDFDMYPYNFKLAAVSLRTCAKGSFCGFCCHDSERFIVPLITSHSIPVFVNASS